MLSDRGDAYALRIPADVPQGARVCELALGLLAGAPVESQCEVRRFDLAHELEFENFRDGLSFLRTAAGLNPPRRMTVPYIKGGTIQTVYYRLPKSGVVDARLYDKGVESGSHRAGERIRIEAQRRPAKSQRFAPEVLAADVDLGAEFGRSIIPQLASEELVSAGTGAAFEHLVQQAASGEIGDAKAERLIGTLAIMQRYGRSYYSEPWKQRRRLADLRDAGIALDDVLPSDRIVPVGQLLRDAVESFR